MEVFMEAFDFLDRTSDRDIVKEIAEDFKDIIFV